jgi:hypothetical protein
VSYLSTILAHNLITLWDSSDLHLQMNDSTSEGL